MICWSTNKRLLFCTHVYGQAGCSSFHSPILSTHKSLLLYYAERKQRMFEKLGIEVRSGPSSSCCTKRAERRARCSQQHAMADPAACEAWGLPACPATWIHGGFCSVASMDGDMPRFGKEQMGMVAGQVTSIRPSLHSPHSIPQKISLA
jgi:hypothetical protein